MKAGTLLREKKGEKERLKRKVTFAEIDS